MAGPSPQALDGRGAASKMDEWASFYQAEMPMLIRYLLKCFGNTDIRDAADAAQSAFTELFTNWDEVHNPRAWLRKVAFRQVLRQQREYPLDALQREPAVLPASARLELREEEQAVLDGLRRLPPKQGQVLALVYDKFSYSEIAEIMDMNKDAVRKNLERARSTLKDHLGLSQSRPGTRQAA